MNYKKNHMFENLGDIIKSNSQYDLYDCKFLNNLTLSRTTLKPSQSTNGHSHKDIEEIYLFISGYGHIQIDDQIIIIGQYDIISIKEGAFHKVINGSKKLDLVFISIFQKYER